MLHISTQHLVALQGDAEGSVEEQGAAPSRPTPPRSGLSRRRNEIRSKGPPRPHAEQRAAASRYCLLYTSLFAKAAENIPARYQEAFATPAFQAAVRSPSGDPTANAQFLSQLKAAQTGSGAGFSSALSDSSFVKLIDPALSHPYLVGFAEAMSAVFLTASAVLVFALIASWFLPHVELRSNAAFAKSRAEHAASGGDAAPPIAH